MNYLREKVAYLKGLAEGMQLDDFKNEGKLLKAMIDVLEDIAKAVDEMESEQESISEQVEEIDGDLAEVENIVYSFNKEYRFPNKPEDEDEEGEEDGEGEELECPHCNEKIRVDDDMLEHGSNIIECPHCHGNVEIECDCGCENWEGDKQE